MKKEETRQDGRKEGSEGNPIATCLCLSMKSNGGGQQTDQMNSKREREKGSTYCLAANLESFLAMV